MDATQQLLDLAESQLIELNSTVAQLRKQLTQLQEENNKLRMNHQELRDKIVPTIEKSMNASSDNGDAPSAGLESLQSFYHEGIHVCHEFFGSRLLPDEECLFCQEVMRRLK